jgi:hypothetical protein
MSPDWNFVPDQWQVQMWAKAFEKLGPDGKLYICAGQLEDCNSQIIPGINVASKIKRLAGEDESAYTNRMTQQTIDEILSNAPDSRVLVLPDGPFAVPVLEKHN